MLIPKQKSKFDVVFYVKCPGQKENTELLIMTKDGTEARNRKYQDVCPVATEAAEPKNEVRVAYNNEPLTFLVNNDTNTMKEFPLWVPLHESEQAPYIPGDWEILKIFFDNNNLQPVWINTDYTWGWYDEETGSWTGGVGQVRLLLSYLFLYFLLMSLNCVTLELCQH